MEHNSSLMERFFEERHKPLNLNFYFQKNKRNPNKHGTIYCYISIKGYKRDSITTSVKCYQEQWNPDKKKITGADAKHLNKELHDFNQKARNLADELRLRSQLTPDNLKKAIRDGLRTDYSALQLYQEILEEKATKNKNRPQDEALTEASLKKYRHYYNYFEEFVQETGRKDMLLSEINRDVGYRFFDWMRYERRRPIHNNSAVKAVHFLSSVLTIAVGKELIINNKLRGLGLKKTPKEELIYLDDSEMYRWETHGFISKNLQICADMFILQYETGMAYKDIENFDFQEMVFRARDGTEVIKGNRHKTGKEFIVPLTPKAKELLEKYRNDVPKISYRGGRKVISLKSYNDNLEIITKYVGIKKHITSHTARATAAMRWWRLGYPDRIIEAMMGASMKIIKQHYAKDTADSVIEAYQQIEQNTKN